MEIFNSITLFFLVLLVPSLRKIFLFPNFNKESDKNVAKKADRYPFFDYAKGIAIISVVLIHSIYIFIGQFQDYNFFWLNMANNLSRFAVGVFFISSGALLTSGLTKKKVIRVFVPYIIACILVGISKNSSWDLIVGGVLRGNLLPPYYFIPVLFQFYLLFPVLNKLKDKKYFLLLSLIISYTFFLIGDITYIGGVHTFGTFLYLFCFGLVFADKFKKEEAFKKLDTIFLIIPVYIALFIFFPGHYFNNRYFFAPAVFILIHYLFMKTKIFAKLKYLKILGKISLWVYLVHFSIERFFMDLFVYNFKYSVFLYISLITIITTVASGLASLVLSKVYENTLKKIKVTI